jgi:hypothetical protein
MITLRGNIVRDFASVTRNSAIPATHSGFCVAKRDAKDDTQSCGG